MDITPSAKGGCPVAHGSGALGGASLIDEKIVAHPLTFYHDMRTKDPVYYDERLGRYLVSRYEDIWTVLRDPVTYAFGLGYRDTLAGEFFAEFKSILERDGGGFFPDVIMTDPPEHTRVRRLTEKAFTAHRVATLEPRITEIAVDLIDTLLARCERGETIEGMNEFAHPYTVRVICEQLGVSQVEASKIQRWAMAYVAQISCMQNHDTMIENAKQVCQLQNFLIAEMKDRQVHPKEDMITDIVHAKLEDGSMLGFDEAVSIVRALMVGGHETTATGIGNLLYLLATRPEIDKALREAVDDDRKLTRFVEEILRIAPPTRALSRTVTRDVELNGKFLPKGAQMLVVFESGNDDETEFGCPRDFDPDRQNLGKHVAFGGGVHRCIGAALARMEIRVAAKELARRLDGIKLTIPAEDVQYLPTVATHTIRALPLIFTRRTVARAAE